MTSDERPPSHRRPGARWREPGLGAHAQTLLMLVGCVSFWAGLVWLLASAL